MKWNVAGALLSFAFLAGICGANPAHAARIPRIELLREIHVAGATVLLSDLLPEDASAGLRNRAAEISLGASPQPGNMRMLEQSVLESRIAASADVLSEIVVPERVVVRREARPIALTEVYDAICNSLPRTGPGKCAALHPQDLLLQSQVLVSSQDAGLRVLRADLDAGLGRARFLLWPANDPKVLPFIVTARLEPGGLDGPGLSGPQASRGENVAAVALRPAQIAWQQILVSAGERATLVLHSDTLRMLADVIPLERGALGQRIRVRMTETGKIFTAQVDGRAHLDLKF